MKAAIKSVGAYLPAKRVHNDDLAKIMDTSDEWIFSRTGIRYRHIADESEAASDLAAAASRQAIERAEISPDEIDLVLVATSTPDFVGLPSTAAIVQHALGIKNAGAMDVVAACSGFVYALETARVYIEAGAARTVLVAGSEAYSKIVNWDDRNTSVLFGDGAGAVIVQAVDDSSEHWVGKAILGSDGSGAETLFRSHGGTRHEFDPRTTLHADTKLKMDGGKVYLFAVRTVGKVIQDLLDRHRITFDDLDWVVPHQANVRIIAETAKRQGFDQSRFFMNIEEVANTSAASIPLALNEMVERSLLKPGMRLVTVGFGAGLTFGGNLIQW